MMLMRIAFYAAVAAIPVGIVLCLFSYFALASMVLGFPAGIGASWCMSRIREIRADDIGESPR